MLEDLSEVYVQTPDYCCRTFTIDKNKIERKKVRTQIYRGSVIAYVFGAEGEIYLINQSIQLQILGPILLFI